MAEKFWNLFKGDEDQTEPETIRQVDERVATSEDLLDRYYSSRQDWAQLALENDEYRNNNQIDDEIKNKLEELNQSPAQWNLIHPAVEVAKEFLTANDPQFQASATEDSDVSTARAVTALMDYIWDNSDGDIHFSQIVDDFYVRGMGVGFAFVEPDADFGRGEVFVKSVDPFTVYFDPSSQDPFCRDSAHVIVADIMTAEQVQQQFSGFRPDILDRATPSHDDRRPVVDRYNPEGAEVGPQKDRNSSDFYEVIDRYSKVKVDRFHVVERPTEREFVFTADEFESYKNEQVVIMDSQAVGRQIVINEGRQQELIDIMNETGGVFHFVLGPQRQVQGQVVPSQQIAAGEPGPNAIPNSRVEISLSNKGEVLDEIALINQTKVDRIKRTLSVGRVLISETVLEIDEYPIIPFMNNYNRNPFPLSDVYYVRELQDQYNKLKSDIYAHLANSKATRAFLPRGSDRVEAESSMRKAGVAIWEYDPDIGEPVLAPPPSLSGEIYAEAARIEQKVKEIFGIFNLSAGDPEDAPRTFNATLLLDENAQRRMGPKIKTLYGGLNILANVVLQYAQNTYTERKEVRLLQPNTQQEQVIINEPVYHEYKDEVIERLNDVTTGSYDIKIISGSTLPVNRTARLQYKIKLYELGIIDDIEVLKDTDISDIEGVVNRKSQLAQATKMIESLQDQISDLEGDLQSATRQVVNARKQKEIEKFRRQATEQVAGAKEALKQAQKSVEDRIQTSLDLGENGAGSA